MTKRRLVLALALAAASILIASSVHAQLPAGKKAPDFTLPELNGRNFTLSKCFVKPAKIVVLDIWATWCPPCRNEIPYLIKLNKKYRAKGVIFAGVALDEKKSTVVDFVKEHKIDYRILHDPNGRKIGPLYNVRPIPETYIIDRKGKIRFVHVGFGGADDAAKMESEIKKLIAEK